MNTWKTPEAQAGFLRLKEGSSVLRVVLRASDFRRSKPKTPFSNHGLSAGFRV